MKSYSTNIIINVNQESVWKILSDVTYWHEWTPTVTKVEAFDSPELKLSNRYKVYQPKLQPAEWTVTVFNAPASFVWESKSAGMTMIAEHTLKSIDNNKTELFLSFSFDRWLGKFIGNLMGKTVQTYIETEAKSLKKKAESL